MDADAAWNQMESVRRRRWQQSVGQRETPGDLVQRLRDRAYSGLPDRLSEQAANEIERLRLTDAEREAVEYFAAFHASPRAGDARSAATLRGLLERLSPPTT